MPGHRRPPVVADDDARCLAQRPHQIDHVAHEMQDGIGVAGFGYVGPAVAAHVRGDGVVAGGGEGLDLGPPTDPQFGEAVDQQDQRP